MWRPKGWGDKAAEFLKDYDDYHRGSYELAYEAGADAILEKLRGIGIKAKAGDHAHLALDIPAYKTKGVNYVVVPRGRGIMVFIPDEVSQ
jgi:hypothetical protein